MNSFSLILHPKEHGYIMMTIFEMGVKTLSCNKKSKSILSDEGLGCIRAYRTTGLENILYTPGDLLQEITVFSSVSVTLGHPYLAVSPWLKIAAFAV